MARKSSSPRLSAAERGRRYRERQRALPVVKIARVTDDERENLLSELRAKRETISIKRYFEIALKLLKGELSVTVVKHYERACRYLIEHIGCEKRYLELTLQHKSEWLAALSTRYEESTVRQYRDFVMAVLSVGVKEGVFDSNPFHAPRPRTNSQFKKHPHPELYNLSEASDYTGWSASHISDLLERGDIELTTTYSLRGLMEPLFSKEELDKVKKPDPESPAATDEVEEIETRETEAGNAFRIRLCAEKAVLPVNFVAKAVRTGLLPSIRLVTYNNRTAPFVLEKHLFRFQKDTQKKLNEGRKLLDLGFKTRSEFYAERGAERNSPEQTDLFMHFDCWEKTGKLTPHSVLIKLESGYHNSSGKPKGAAGAAADLNSKTTPKSLTRIHERVLYDPNEVARLLDEKPSEEFKEELRKLFRKRKTLPVEELTTLLFKNGIVGQGKKRFLEEMQIVRESPEGFEKGIFYRVAKNKEWNQRREVARVHAADEWLKQFMDKHNGCATSVEVHAASEEADIKSATLENARKRAGIEVKRVARKSRKPPGVFGVWLRPGTELPSDLREPTDEELTRTRNRRKRKPAPAIKSTAPPATDSAKGVGGKPRKWEEAADIFFELERANPGRKIKTPEVIAEFKRRNRGKKAPSAAAVRSAVQYWRPRKAHNTSA